MGTAGRAAIPGIDIAGKTGSAQTVSNDLKKKMGASEKGLYKDNGWFVGVSPRRNPEIVVACLFEGGEHGASGGGGGDQGDQGVRGEAAQSPDAGCEGDGCDCQSG